MGIKLSKLFKHTYVVSEGVQTDLSIQSCDEVFGYNSFVTPPRDVQHLCDPRSVTRGIARTPIMCQLHNEICSPIKEVKKPYLETNLDEIPYVESADSSAHVIDVYQPSCNNSVNYYNSESDFAVEYPDCPLVQHDSMCKIEIIDKCEVDVNCYDNPAKSLESIESYCGINVNESKPDPAVDEVIARSESLNEPFVTSRTINIDSSETVQQVCQKILDELLCESTGNVVMDKSNESDEEIFVDGNISDIVSSMKKLCIDNSSVPCNPLEKNSKIVIPSDSFASTDCMLHPSKMDNVYNIGDQFGFKNSPKKVNRQPLREVNRNTQAIRPQISDVKTNADSGNSSLKSILPLLPPQVPPSTSKVKPHRSKWDTENTLII